MATRSTLQGGNMIYLNNAATTFPKPETVKAAVAACLNMPIVHGTRAGNGQTANDVRTACREALAELFHAPQPERIILTSGATESLNLAIFGLELHHAHVVTTAAEHNSTLRPLKHLERAGAINLTIAPCERDGSVEPEAVIEQITDQTKLVVVNHCSNVTGAALDLQPIGEVTTARGIPFVVDASQSAGNLPLDVEAMHIDFLAFTGHKGLYGIQGTGGAFIRENLHLKPLKVGGTGIRDAWLCQPEEMPTYYEAGTPNLPGIAGLLAGIEFIQQIGMQRIRQHKASLVARMLKYLESRDDVTVYACRRQHSIPGVVSFNLNGLAPQHVSSILEQSFEIIVRAGLHCAPLIHHALHTALSGTVRVSPSYFTTDQEITTFLSAVEIIRNAYKHGDVLPFSP